MSTTNRFTPPPELIGQWIQEWVNTHGPDKDGIDYVVAQAAQWGADQELEACIGVLGGQWESDLLGQCTGWKEFRDQSEEILRAARRPKPPTLKQRALQALDAEVFELSAAAATTIRRALEALDD